MFTDATNRDAPNPTILVVAGVIVSSGRVLVCQRREGSHLAGMWEFPGGKVEPDEDPRIALRRELEEELGIVTCAADVVDVVFHRYPKHSVVIVFFAVSLAEESPSPRAVDVGAFAWRCADELDGILFSPADMVVVERVRGLLR